MRTGVRHQTFSSVSRRRQLCLLLHSRLSAVLRATLPLVLLAAPDPLLRAQTAAHQQYEISSITFEGNESFTASELLGQMTTRETPGGFNKFLYANISERLGRKNEYFIAVAFYQDAERIKRFYENRGFSMVKVDTVLHFSAENATADLTLRITEGYRSLIEQVVYGGILEYPETIWEDLRRAPKIYPADPYNSQLLEDEVSRVLRVYADNGFPNAQFVRDSSYARRYTSSNNYMVKLVFSPGHRYIFGDITLRQDVDTLRGEAFREDITDDIVLRQLD